MAMRNVILKVNPILFHQQSKHYLIDAILPSFIVLIYPELIALLINKECLHNYNLSNIIAIISPTNVFISSNTKNSVGINFALGSIMLRKSGFVMDPSASFQLFPFALEVSLMITWSSYFSLDFQICSFLHYLTFIF